jgi:hypothetical protein
MEDFINNMKQRYMQDSILIGNVYSIIKTIFILLIIFHLFACSWIYIGSGPDGWRNTQLNDYMLDSEVNVYVTAIYFVTTNATTIGYGDIYGNTIKEKLFIVFLEFVGILVFSLITGKIRNMKTPTKIKDHID